MDPNSRAQWSGCTTKFLEQAIVLAMLFLYSGEVRHRQSYQSLSSATGAVFEMVSCISLINSSLAVSRPKYSNCIGHPRVLN